MTYRTKRTLIHLAIVIAFVVGFALLTAGDKDDRVESTSTGTNISDNVDTGWVKVWENDVDTYKRCDGSSMVYSDRIGLTVVPNSQECAK